MIGTTRRCFVVFVCAVSFASSAIAERPHINVSKMFGNLVDYHKVIVETEGIPVVPGQPAGAICLIGAVELASDAPREPPRLDRSRGPSAEFGGAWQPTPLPSNRPRGRDLLTICQPYLTSGLTDMMREALETPGSYVVRDWQGTELQIYAPERGFAVSVRFAIR